MEISCEKQPLSKQKQSGCCEMFSFEQYYNTATHLLLSVLTCDIAGVALEISLIVKNLTVFIIWCNTTKISYNKLKTILLHDL